MECNKCGSFNCGLLGIVIGILAGIAAGIVFPLGLIPTPENLVIITGVIAIVGLVIFLLTTLLTNKDSDVFSIKRCICSIGKYLILGSIGAIITGTVVLTRVLVATSLLSAILVGLTAFFFIVTIVSIVCLFVCLLNRLCNCCN